MKFYFLNTCAACPEQYDVYRENGELCGYVRLRWGVLRADYPNIDGETIYTKTYEDDFKGCFDNEEERNKELLNIAVAYKDAILGDIVYNLDMQVEYEYIVDPDILEERLKSDEE